jgi:fatty-acyl-CoA synthase
LIELETIPGVRADGSAAKSWLRALELTASIPRNCGRVLPTLIEDLAAKSGHAPALLSDRECFTYQELVARSNQYARWALELGLTKGDVVGLMMTNRPEYFAAWIGITSVGGVVALLNTNLAGPSLAHCIDVVRPKQILVSAEFAGSLASALPSVTMPPPVWCHGAVHSPFPQVDPDIDRQANEALDENERPALTIDDRALYIFTSGTTGMPKAVKVSHARVMQWSLWFAGMMGIQPADRIYSCLPTYHSIGGVLAPGAALAGGGSIVFREKFSASQFWSDIVRWDCTMFQYIGEFCRYLLRDTSTSNVSGHRIRLACGNGLAPDVWEEFKIRFGIPRILEFYASTEGGVSLFNAEGKRGAIGRIPPYLTHRFSPALVRFDVETGEPVRDAQGFCISCAVNEPGEALGKIVDDPSNVGSRFEGYTDERASEKKILRNAFKAGDVWVRTGDLMRKDENGFFYFVDRVGDTFRWKGENVATSEVSEAICAFPGVKHASVYGVTIPATEGRVGMAAVVADGQIDLSALRKHLGYRLPSYARPVFLRIQQEIEVTGTFKYSKTELVTQGYDPAATTDILYFDDPEAQVFRRLDDALYERIRSGQIQL